MTGASGYLGQNALAVLSRRGVPVVAIGRNRPNLPAGAEFFRIDLLEKPDLSGVVARSGASHLLHLAWFAEHGRYWTSSENLRWVDATTALVGAFVRAGGQAVVVAGTSAEYDWSHGYCREQTTPCEPKTLYGVAKDVARRLCVAIATAANVPLAWARVFLSYGPHEAPGRLVPSLAAALRGKCGPFAVDGGAYRDFLHARDVGAALITLLEQRHDGVVNVSSGEPLRVADLVRAMAKVLDADPVPILAMARPRPGDPRLIVGDNSRLLATGWEPSFDLAAGLRQTLIGAG